MFHRADNSPARRARRHLGAIVTIAMLVLAAPHPAVAQASPGPSRDSADRYEADRALCISGLTHQEREDCLREAAAARQAARRGKLENPGDAAEYRRNALRRCERLPEQFREDCIARMQGEGTMTEGSVEGGGIYRERRELIPAPTPAPGPASSPSRPPPAGGAGG